MVPVLERPSAWLLPLGLPSRCTVAAVFYAGVLFKLMYVGHLPALGMYFPEGQLSWQVCQGGSVQGKLLLSITASHQGVTLVLCS